MSALRAMLRIARRDAWRHKGTSILAIVLIGLPIAAAVGGDVLYRSTQIPTSVALDRALGTADASFRPAPVRGPLTQDAWGKAYSSEGAETGDHPVTIAQIVAGLPAGSRASVQVTTSGDAATVNAREPLTVMELDLGDRLSSGRFAVTAGALPSRDDQVAISRAAARALNVGVGDTINVAGSGASRAGARTISAILLSPESTDREFVIGRPGSFGIDPNKATMEWDYPTMVFVDSPTPIGQKQVAAANAEGILVTSRAYVADPAPAAATFTTPTARSLATTTLVAAVIGMLLLQIVLLAGPAFAVATRRQHRVLALTAAAGGAPKHLRAIVLAQGVVLGAIAGVGAIVVGIGAGTLLTIPFGGHYMFRHFLGPITVRPLEVLGIAAVAVLTALAASLIPALTASRREINGALSQAPAPSRMSRTGLPLIGAGLMVVGAGLTTVVARALVTAGSSNSGAIVALVIGMACLEVGLLLLVPTVLRLIARTARFLPLTFRLAARDAARSSSRTTPAIAAAMSVLIVAVMAAIALPSADRRDAARYQPETKIGWVQVQPDLWGSRIPDATWESMSAGLRATMPIDQVLVASGPAPAFAGPNHTAVAIDPSKPSDGPGVEYRLVRTDRNVCVLDTPTESTDATETVDASDPRAGLLPSGGSGAHPSDAPTPAKARELAKEPQCRNLNGGRPVGATGGISRMAIDDGSGAALLAPAAPEAARAALRSGKAIVFSPYDQDGGHALIEVSSGDDQMSYKRIRVPAVVLDGAGTTSRMVLPTSVARQIGMPVARVELLASSTSMPSKAAEAQARKAISIADPNARVEVERGYTSAVAALIPWALAIAALLALAVVAITVALALADARGVLATMAAVGATPRIRRAIAAAQGVVISTIALLLAIPTAVLCVASIFGYANKTYSMSLSSTMYPTQQTVQQLTISASGWVFVFVLALPLLAAGLMALFTRSRITLTRPAE